MKESTPRMSVMATVMENLLKNAAAGDPEGRMFGRNMRMRKTARAVTAMR